MPRQILLFFTLLLSLFASTSRAETRALPAATRGIYVPALRASKENLPKTIDVVRKAGLNTLVVDIKDIDGQVSLASASDVTLATLSPEERRIDASGLALAAKKHHLWLIARISLFQDPCIVAKHPEWAAKNPDGSVYLSEGGQKESCGPLSYVSPYIDSVWNYHLELSRKAVEAGFHEIQLDYIRFPDEPDLQLSFPGSENSVFSRSDTIAKGIAKIRRELPSIIALSADVFGRVVDGTDEIIGQDLVKIGSFVDYISPMVYPSLWNKGHYGVEDPVRMPYEIISKSIGAAKFELAPVRSPPRIRPWVQHGEWPELPYGRTETQAQLRALRDQGVLDWLLWNSDGQYDPAAIVNFPTRNGR